MTTDFFQTGGTLSEDAPCYIERPADNELLNALNRGELCMILAPRQTGKSSLMIHAIAELKKIGIRAAIVDLQPLAIQKEPAAWFNDVVYQIERSLKLDTDALSWWQANARLGSTQRFMTFMEDVVLSEIQERVVIFFDEIDSVLSLPFSDDFFTTIRAMVNAKANNPILRRLNFVLLGVANPSDFIKDRSRTPFNIGKEIPLTDFDPASLSRFEEVIGNDSKSVLDRIFYWTAGQPQMVQKLAEAVYPLPAEERSPEKVDDIVHKAYLGTRIDNNIHLKFIRDYLLEGHNKVRKTLNTYKSVLDAKPVAYDEQSPVHSRLRLSGVIKAENNALVTRNRVYQTVFDKQWIKQNTPRDKAMIAAFASSFALVLVLIWFLLLEPKIFTSEKEYMIGTRAIIVNGTTAKDNISDQTKIDANYAYQTLLHTGYTAESIYYMSFDKSSEGVDAKATYANISDAINHWTKQDPVATELLIYLIGHGDEGIFQLNKNEVLKAEELSQWLDELQNTLNIPVTLVYDSCCSGMFLTKLKPPVGKKRIVISSSSPTEPAYFFGSGLSFSHQFWNAIYQGNEIGKAFRIASMSNRVKTYQTAMLDANGNGIGNEPEDEKIADGIQLQGSSWQIDIPYIYKVSPPQTIQDQSFAKLNAYISIKNRTPIRKVWANIAPPGFDFGSPNTPITHLPEIELYYKGDDVYEGRYNGFIQNGTYNIMIRAVNVKGVNTLSRQTSVTKESMYIAKVSESVKLYKDNTSATIWAAINAQYKGITISRVWAKITPPLLNAPSVEVDMLDPENDGIYEVTYDNFIADGTYSISIYAKDSDGHISPAIKTTVTHIELSSDADMYEKDDMPEMARLARFNMIQHHNFHQAEDVDWVKFLAMEQEFYKIRTFNLSTECDTVIEIYKIENKSLVLLESVNNNGKGQEEVLNWKCPKKGIYYVKVKNSDPNILGHDIVYDFEIMKMPR